MKKKAPGTFYMRQVDQAAFAFSVASALILTFATIVLLTVDHARLAQVAAQTAVAG